MNEQLSEPVFRAVRTYWERVFVGKLREELEAFKLGVHAALKAFLDDAAPAIVASGGDGARVAAMRRPLEETLHASLAGDVEKIREYVQGKQRDVNRELVPAVQAAYKPGYTRGFAEAGAGSHRRRVDIIEQHVDTHRQELFMEAIKPITGYLTDLVEEVGCRATAALAKLPPVVEVNSGVLWIEDGAAGREARARLVGPFEVAACEVGLNTFANPVDP